MLAGLSKAAVVLTAAAGSAVVSVLGGQPTPRAPVASPFGASTVVHIAHVGQIELDLEPAGTAALRQVPCAARLYSGTTCYLSSR